MVCCTQRQKWILCFFFPASAWLPARHLLLMQILRDVWFFWGLVCARTGRFWWRKIGRQTLFCGIYCIRLRQIRLILALMILSITDCLWDDMRVWYVRHNSDRFIFSNIIVIRAVITRLNSDGRVRGCSKINACGHTARLPRCPRFESGSRDHFPMTHKQNLPK